MIMKNWIELSRERKQEILRQASDQLNLTAESVEKDFWVVVVLRALFSLPVANQLVFKGGTSLSKCWNFLQRFSEDIDIAMNRELIGFGGDLSNTQRKKIRKVACEYVSTTLKEMLRQRFVEMGFAEGELTVEAEPAEAGTTDRDPQKLFVSYDSIVAQSGYLRDRVVIEIGSRSQLEPAEQRSLNSLVAQALPREVLTRSRFLSLQFHLHEHFWKRSFCSMKSFKNQMN